MAEWDFVLASSKLKGKQMEMHRELTGIFDILNSMKEEAARMQDKWRGEALRRYLDTFQQELSGDYEYAREIGNLIDRLAQMERSFEKCEAEILSLIG